MPSYLSGPGASGVVLFLDAGAEAAAQVMCAAVPMEEQAMRAVMPMEERAMRAAVPVENVSVAWGSAAVQRQILPRMHKRRVEFCSLSQSLIDSAELMRKIQENIYYKLLLNEADLN